MMFRMLLWLLGYRINQLALKSAGFKKAIGDYRIVLQFKTADGKAQRYYAFDAGKTSSHKGLHPAPTMAMVFKTPKDALQLIKRMGKAPKDKTVFIYAIRDGELAIEGDMAYLTFFQAISRYFGPEPK